ncbi:GIY-YIG nuclease family protein [Escherichia coli]
MAMPSSVMRSSGCPRCAGNVLLSAEIVNERLAARGIKLIGEYVNNTTKTQFQCQHSHEWMAMPDGVMRGKGCPRCAGTAPLSADIINERMADRGIKLIGTFTGVMRKTQFQCQYGHEWMTKPNSIMNGHGCPHCATRGVWGKKGVMVYVLLYGADRVKIGITLDFKTRKRTLRHASGSPILPYALFQFGEGGGKAVWEIEQQAHAHFATYHCGLSGFAGATELFTADPDDVVAYLEQLGGVDILAQVAA